jgi:hypothetical protein
VGSRVVLLIYLTPPLRRIFVRQRLRSCRLPPMETWIGRCTLAPPRTPRAASPLPDFGVRLWDPAALRARVARLALDVMSPILHPM